MTGESLSQCQTADVQRTLADCLGENWQSVGKCQTASNLGVIHMSFGGSTVKLFEKVLGGSMQSNHSELEYKYFVPLANLFVGKVQ